MPGPHYAISEAVLVLAALWATVQLFRHGSFLAAAGIFLFGAAAAMGVWRFGTNAIDEWATVHRAMSLTGGVMGLSLILAEMLRLRFSLFASTLERAVLGLVLCTLAVETFVAPTLATPIFLIVLVSCIVLAYLLPDATRTQQAGRAGVMGLFLFNIIAIRGSAFLDPAVSWHLYHLFIAIWAVGIVWTLCATRTTD